MTSFRSCLRTSAVLSVTVTLAAASSAGAQGFIIVDPAPVVIVPVPRPPQPRIAHFPLEVKNQNVTCTIQDTVGKTRVEQIFHNPNPRQMEGTYMLPMPDTAAIQKFSMWMDGREVKGEILDAEKARQTYEDIVRRTKDPGLLEYVGQRLYRARVFPIPANGDVRIALEYSESITVSDGLATYRYPLNTEKYSAKPIESVSITLDITSQIAIKSVFCPSHTATISQSGEKQARVGFEARQVTPDRDFVVHYLMSDKEFGLSLLTYKPAAEDGYFLARLSPPFAAAGDKITPKDVCFVLDTSGSMAGDKIVQAKKALAFCVSSLRKEDRFNVISFATDVRPFRESLVEANSENLAAARAEIEKLEAAGGTAISDALLQALKMAPPGVAGQYRAFMIVFITDGEPTVGERDPDKILASVKAAPSQSQTRLFVFGVGHDLNARLLDRLADDNRGAREYIAEKEDIEVKVSSFFKKVSDPVLNEIDLKFTGSDTFDVYPKTWPDLFHGSELVVVGRYRQPGKHSVTMTGKRGSESLTWRFDATFADATTASDFLPRLWATRKIGYLMDEIRLHGQTQELKDEIVSLAKRHAIVTPYTSYLVIEDTPGQTVASAGGLQLRSAQDRYFYQSRELSRLNEAPRRTGGSAAGGSFGALGPQAGADAVHSSKEAIELRERDVAAAARPGSIAGAGEPPRQARPEAAAEKLIRHVGGKTFYFEKDRWIDSTYDGKAATQKLEAFSDAYFAVLKERPEVGKYLALGERLIVVLNNVAYEIEAAR